MGKVQNTKHTTTVAVLLQGTITPLVPHTAQVQGSAAVDKKGRAQVKAARMSRAREVLHEEIFSISVVSRLRYDQGT